MHKSIDFLCKFEEINQMTSNKIKLSIKSWAESDRPREKMMLKGAAALSDAELIAILIGSGNRNESAVSLARRILQAVDNNINKLATLSLEELIKFKGIGEAKAISILTALELGKRRQLEQALQHVKISSSNMVFELMQPILSDLPHEEFWMLYLNNANKLLLHEQISKGGMTATVVDVRLVLKKALTINAVGLIMVHNHPSGNLKVSASDKQITKKLQEAGQTLDIKLLDHLIVTQNNYYSFADEGAI